MINVVCNDGKNYVGNIISVALGCYYLGKLDSFDQKLNLVMNDCF